VKGFIWHVFFCCRGARAWCHFGTRFQPPGDMQVGCGVLCVCWGGGGGSSCQVKGLIWVLFVRWPGVQAWCHCGTLLQRPGFMQVGCRVLCGYVCVFRRQHNISMVPRCGAKLVHCHALLLLLLLLLLFLPSRLPRHCRAATSTAVPRA
jgi:hypothetical protein